MARRKYGVFRTILDLVLIVLTGGLWLLWIIIRFLRSNSN